MPHFSKLTTTYLTKGHCILVDDLVCADGRIVPKDFITDYATIPWFARSLVPSKDIPISATFHDKALADLECRQIKSRARLDAWLRINKQMIADMDHQGRHVGKIRKRAIHLGIDINAFVKCIILNQPPKKAVTKKDL